MELKKFTGKILLVALTLILGGAGCVSTSNTKGASSLGVFASTNSGDTWQALNSLPTGQGVKSLGSVAVSDIVSDPNDPHTLYWLSQNNGLLFSYDDGVTWQQPKGAMLQGSVTAVAVDPKQKCTIYASNGVTIWRTDDCNRSWVEIYSETRQDVKIVSLAANKFASGEIYAGASNGDLLKSSNKGAAWTTVKRFGLTLGEIKLSDLKNNVIYVGTRKNGLFKSADGGVTWENYKDKLQDFAKGLEFRNLYLSPSKADVVYWVSTYGILVSEDGGKNWRALSLLTAPGSVSIHELAVSSQNDKDIFYVASSQTRNALYLSSDGGSSWTTKKLPSNQLPTGLYLSENDKQIIFVGFSPLPKK